MPFAAVFQLLSTNNAIIRSYFGLVVELVRQVLQFTQRRRRKSQTEVKGGKRLGLARTIVFEPSRSLFRYLIRANSFQSTLASSLLLHHSLKTRGRPRNGWTPLECHSICFRLPGPRDLPGRCVPAITRRALLTLDDDSHPKRTSSSDAPRRRKKKWMFAFSQFWS